MEVKGISSHGSAPERGDNAIFKMGHILSELEVLHGRLKDDDFLGKGSLSPFIRPLSLSKALALDYHNVMPSPGLLYEGMEKRISP